MIKLRTEQERISVTLALAEREVAQSKMDDDQLRQGLERALSLICNAHDTYGQGRRPCPSNDEPERLIGPTSRTTSRRYKVCWTVDHRLGTDLRAQLDEEFTAIAVQKEKVAQNAEKFELAS